MLTQKKGKELINIKNLIKNVTSIPMSNYSDNRHTYSPIRLLLLKCFLRVKNNYYWRGGAIN